MPVFAAPIADTSAIPGSRRHLSAIRRDKRKRSPSPSSDEDEKSLLGEEPTPSVSAATNPLSLRPDEIVQYQLAGLELNEELPQSALGGVPDFPHRALPLRPVDQIHERVLKQKEKHEAFSDGETSRKLDDEKEKTSRPTALRTQHLNVLTALLHRCLQEGDIPRATRAWSLLIRTQIRGQAIDIRSSGFWGIGAELLARSLDPPNELVNQDGIEKNARRPFKARWGTGQGLQKAIEYYQTLINLFPYRRQNAESVGALDFWPAMLGCKIYEIQLEQREGLDKIAQAEEDDDNDNSDDEHSAEESEEDQNDDNYDGFAAEHRKRVRRRQKRKEKRWEERDELRKNALKSCEVIAATLKDLMLSKEYYSHALRRFGGMLALYIGDLSVPAKPNEVDESEEPDLSGKSTERRLVYSRRMAEYRMGKEKQETERELAKEMFDSIKADGGYIGGNIGFLYPENDQDEFEDAEEW